MSDGLARPADFHHLFPDLSAVSRLSWVHDTASQTRAHLKFATVQDVAVEVLVRAVSERAAARSTHKLSNSEQHTIGGRDRHAVLLG